jgi:hypothetical protein
MKEIPLTRGLFALVDDEYYNFLMQWKWYATPGKNTFYAVRNRSRDRRKDSKGSKIVHMHRVIMKTRDDEQVDHIDHNGLNNQRCNLRNCTAQQNTINSRPYSESGYRGVYYQKRHNKVYIRASIVINGRAPHLGIFKTEVDAAMARDRIALLYLGDYAYLNFDKSNYV